jgi:hypothetical protein
MIKLPVKVRFEQAVYGSFPFWHRGYAVLAHSEGCRPEWLAELRTVCQRCGEPPTGLMPAESLFALRLECGPWMIVGAFPQGHDDQDRPGALAFHALFVDRWSYRWIGANPFALAGSMSGDWSAADRDRTLPVVTWTGGETRTLSPSTPATDDDDDPRLTLVVNALTQGRRVVIQSNEPIENLARSVWRALPRAVRRRATVATWAFDNANQFDLVGLPKLAGVALNASDLILALEHVGR